MMKAASHARVMEKTAEKIGHFQLPDSRFMVTSVAMQGTYSSMKIMYPRAIRGSKYLLPGPRA